MTPQPPPILPDSWNVLPGKPATQWQPPRPLPPKQPMRVGTYLQWCGFAWIVFVGVFIILGLSKGYELSIVDAIALSPGAFLNGLGQVINANQK